MALLLASIYDAALYAARNTDSKFDSLILERCPAWSKVSIVLCLRGNLPVQTVISTLMKEEHALNGVTACEQRLHEFEGMLSRLAGIGRSVNGDCIFHPRMLAKRASAGPQLRRGYSATPQAPDVLEDDH